MSLERAVKHALKNPIKAKGRTSISRFGAILTDDFSTYYGWNSYRTHPLQAKFAAQTGTPEKIHVHAELSVCIQAAKTYLKYGKKSDLSGFRLYVARVLANGTPALAKPCDSCLAALIEFGINEVIYTES